MESIKELLSRYGFSFKKQYGQNFITDTNLLKSIVASAEVEGLTVLEIGCGAGTLTRELSAVAKKVIGYEIDYKLEPILAETTGDKTNVEIVFKDVMKTPLPDLERYIGEEYALVANLPYYITTPLIMRFIDGAKRLKKLIIMVQEEVAERLVAKENTPEYGAITASINVRANTKIIKRVPRNMFLPAPKVDSAVVSIELAPNKFNVKDFKVYKDVLHSAFNNRRKMLVNNFMQIFNLNRANAEEVLTACDISLTARGETLSVEKFVTLSNYLVENVL